jgi:aminoglycoside 3-N-acetyltransferase I
MQILRLTPSHRATAKDMFAMMADIFGEEVSALSDHYVDRLLGVDSFWAIAALDGNKVVGGITAHTLPMTRTECSEVFIYDIAVSTSYRRQGVGRRLVKALQEYAEAAGIRDVFVAAENDDIHALDFYRSLGGEPSSATFFLYQLL